MKGHAHDWFKRYVMWNGFAVIAYKACGCGKVLM